MNVVVLGGAGQGRQTIDVLDAAGAHRVVAVVDPGLAPGTTVSGHPVVEPDALDALGVEGFVVAVGDNFARAAAIERARADYPALTLVSAVHPAAVVARDAVVGAGATLMAGAVIGNGCVVGDGVILGTNASLDHDSQASDYVSLAPGAVTGGDVTIGAYTALGLGAKVVHGVMIGAHTVIGAGAVVLHDVPDHVVAVGLPARVTRTRPDGEPYLGRRRPV